jgi:hypothetical protein
MILIVKQILLLLFCLLISMPMLLAQYSERSIGLRAGGSTGVVAKWFLNDYKAGEAILSFREGGLQLTGLAEFHTPLYFDVPGQVSVYYGLGVHIGFYRGHRHLDDFHDHDHHHGAGLALGPNAIAGVQYFLEQIPASVSLDYKPFIDLLRFNHFFRGLGDFAFSFRYHF